MAENNSNQQQQIANAIYRGVGHVLQAQDDFFVWFGSIPLAQKLIVVGVFLGIILSVLYYVYNMFRTSDELAFDNAPSFITNLGKLPNTKVPFSYKYADGRTVPYLPSSLFPIGNNRQFTWCFWLYVNGYDPRAPQRDQVSENWSYRIGQYKHVLSHGSSDIANGREDYQFPGFWIKPNHNTLACVVSTVGGPLELDLPDFDMNKWFHVTLVLDENNLALYRNGGLETSVPLQYQTVHRNGQDVHLFGDGGFAGGLYYLQYFNKALSPTQVQLIYSSQKPALDAFMYKQEYTRTVSRRLQPTTENVNAGIATGAIVPTTDTPASPENVHSDKSTSWFSRTF